MLDLGAFTLQRAVIEIRYDPAFPIWDRAGSLASRLRKIFPALKFKEARPNQQVFSLNEKLSLRTELDKAFLIAYFPPNNLDEFRSSADKTCAILIEVFELAALTRIGFRVFFEKKFGSKIEATQFVIDQMPLFKRTGKYFNIEGKGLTPHFNLRWEDDFVGCSVAFQTVETKLEIEIPAEFGEDISSLNKEKHFAQLDVDYYAHASTPVAKFNAVALIENWMKLIRRDVASFLNG